MTTFRRKNEQITNIQSKIYALNDRISEEYGHLHKALNDAGRLHKKETEPRVNGKEGESKETGGENKDPSTDSAANGSNESQTETKAKTSVDVYV